MRDSCFMPRDLIHASRSMMRACHRTWIEIDEDALAANARMLRALLSPGTQLLAVVKANAYGHGLVPVSRILESHADWLGVDALEEGIALREAGISAPILVFGYTPPERAAELIRYRLRQVVSDLQMLGALDDAARHLGERAVVHLKIETGMGRQGLLAEDLPRFLSALKDFRGVVLEGAATHFAHADTGDGYDDTAQQAQRFRQAIEVFSAFALAPLLRHASASSGAFLSREFHFDLVRFGIALYGVWPAPHFPEMLVRQGRALSLRPVLTWRCRIAQVKRLPSGAPIGYGGTERLARESRIAVLPIGYADGYDRRLSSRGNVLIGGKRARVLGRVSMNIIVADITDIPDAQTGGAATILGRDGNEEISAWELAKTIGTIPYEVLARLNPLIPRIIR